MKKSPWIYLLSLLIFLGVVLGVAYKCDAQKPCDFVIPLGTFQFNAAAVKPGQTICFAKGTRGPAEISNMVGTPEAPIVLTNEPSGKTIIKGSGNKNSQGFYITGFVMNVLSSSNFIVQGKNNPSEQWGLDFSLAHMGPDFKQLSTDFEIYGLWIHDVSSVGIVAKTDPTCDSKTWRGNFTMNNVRIHDNLVQNVGGEGTYIGNSHYNGLTKSCGGVNIKVLEHDVLDPKVYNNQFLGTGQDGIQIGGAIRGMEIYDNVVRNYGNRNVKDHLSGIQVNQGSTGIVRNNRIESGKGFGIFLGGSGGMTVYENLVIGAEQGGVLASDFPPIITSPILIHNNTFINCRDYIVWINTKSAIGNSFKDNVVVRTQIKTDFFFNTTAQKATWLMEGNIITTELASLMLDVNYVPLQGSPAIVPGGLDKGYAQHIPFEIKTTYPGSVEVTETSLDGVITNSEIWIVTPNGRYRIK